MVAYQDRLVSLYLYLFPHIHSFSLSHLFSLTLLTQ